MRNDRAFYLWGGLLFLLAGCSAAEGGGQTIGGDGGRRAADGALIAADGAAIAADGALLGGMDGGGSASETGAPGDDGGGATGEDGSTPIDPETGLPLEDGAVVTPGGDGGSGGDGSSGGGTGCVTREVCGNGLDDNCDGTVDDNCPCLPGSMQSCYDGPPAQAGRGVCVLGTQMCSPGTEFGTWGPCVGAGRPQPVVCGQMMDFRCTGIVDEGCGCTLGTSRSCYGGPPGTMGVGLCRAGMQTCVARPGGGADWGPCDGQVTPTPELCDGMDHDCNGMMSSSCACVVGTSRSCYTGPMGTSGVGTCRAGTQMCVAGSGGMGSMWGACTGEVTPQPNTCDGIDRMCNGNPTEGCACTVGARQGCYSGPAGTRGVGICRDGMQTCVAMGSGSGWGGCSGMTTPMGSEVCGNMQDDNCNGQVDEGCGGMITCPGNRSTPAGTAVMLSASGSGLSNFNWTIVSAPDGGAGTARWSPSPANAMTETFTPFIVGDYRIRVSARDGSGNTVTCEFVVTAQPHGLRVQLSWNGTGDVDLHVHNGNRTRWFGAANSDDCYYSNRTPSWGASLDFDNTDRDGPENTVIDNPVIGMPYTIAIHNFARAAGRVATVRVFCGNTMGTTPTQTFTSRALQGSGSGQCTNNDFWKMATVTFTSPSTCTITSINTYTTGSNACNNF